MEVARAMAMQNEIAGREESLVARFPVASYFGLTFAVSWMGALALGNDNRGRELQVFLRRPD
jgi:hypothetical protein